jgi:hydrogenase maturation protease
VNETVVIGVGNRMMGDDAVGPVVLDRLGASPDGSVALVESVGDATHLLDTWRDAKLAIVVDAVISGGVPGTIRRIDAGEGLPTSWRSASTHLVGVGEAVELGGVLGGLPDELIVYGVEIGSVAPGVALSARVDAAADRLVVMLEEELAAAGFPPD